MNITPEVKHLLKQLRLSGILSTLPDRVSYAAGNKLTYQEFFELVLSDELERRRHGTLERRLHNAKVNLDQVMERFDWDAKITLDRERLKSLLGLEFIDRKENVIFTGPVGVGKTYLANALAHAACRREKNVLVKKAAKMFKDLYAARADNSLDRELMRLVTSDLLVIDDFGLKRMTQEQADDFYEILSERYERSSTIITSNRHVDEWTALFDDAILANSALDRLAHNAHQLVIEGESYRRKKGLRG
jgi:DNA replication protein DnaC